MDISFGEGQLVGGGGEQGQQVIGEIVNQSETVLYFRLDDVHDEVVLDEEVLPTGQVLRLLIILQVLADLKSKGGVVFDLGSHCYALAHPALPFP